MSTIKASQVIDETLLKCMKDYLDDPARYHPEYLPILLNDYERRVKDKVERAAPARPLSCTAIANGFSNCINP